MLEGIGSDFVERMQTDWAQGGDYSKRLDRICEGVFDVAKERSSLLRLFTMTTDVIYEDGGLPGDRIQQQIKSMYREAMGEGAFRNGDLDMMSSMAHGLVEGAMMRWMRTGAPSETNASKELANVMKHGFHN
ncbi:MAG: hypothetical protein AAF590_13465 [Pseudomonadota bacterium]